MATSCGRGVQRALLGANGRGAEGPKGRGRKEFWLARSKERRFPMRVFAAAVVLSLIGLSYVQSQPQSATNVIQAFVADSGGAPLAGVHVELRRDGSIQARTTTDGRGGFRFEKLSAGVYEVRLILTGFVPVSTTVVVGDRPLPMLRLTMSPPNAAAAKSQE